jgi:hypothetical protein
MEDIANIISAVSNRFLYDIIHVNTFLIVMYLVLPWSKLIY